MNQYNEISTLQYMGSKTRIISHICEPIIKNKSIKTVVDLFAGTGSIGYALKAHKNIICRNRTSAVAGIGLPMDCRKDLPTI